ncbi:MAG: FAD-dependent oxidoreductase, partial [Planctomycetota bacterium]
MIESRHDDIFTRHDDGPVRHFDALILGSGFAGSTLAMVLASQGMRTLVVDPKPHPRMSIGESSTPLADGMLRYLARRYGLPLLERLSTYAGCQKLAGASPAGRPRVGLKRGFTYYQHHRGQSFREIRLGEQSMLIAASRSDAGGDTHWLRYDVDALLAQEAENRGAVMAAGFTLSDIERSSATRDARIRLVLKKETDASTT